MNMKSKNLLLTAGVIGCVVGAIGMMPALMEKYYIGVSGFTVLLIAGIILLAIAFGDQNEWGDAKKSIRLKI